MMAGLLKKCRAALLDLLFPPKCAFCGRLLERPGDVCEACEKDLPYREEGKILSAIGEEGFPCAVALYYDGMVRSGVRALKFGKKSWRAGVFARYVAQTVAEQLGGDFDAVTFVPPPEEFPAGLRSGPPPGGGRREDLGRQGGAHPAEGAPYPGPVLPGRPRGPEGERKGRLRRPPSGADPGPPVPAHRRRVHHRQHHGVRRGSADGGGRGPGGMRRPGRGTPKSGQTGTSGGRFW